MSSILITGASGRIGRNLIPALLRSGDQVRVLVKENMVENESVEIFYGDILDRATIEKAVKNVDVVYHLAAVTDSLASKDEMHKVNVLGTKNLLEAGKGKKFIYLSTASVMGKNFKELPVNEQTKCNPSNFYAKTKLEAEKLVLENGGIVIRSPDIFSSGFLKDYNFVLSGLENGKMPIIGDGKNFIQWIHINDLVQALVLAKNLGKPGQLYIVAGKEFKTLKQMLSMLCSYLDVEPPQKHTSGLLAKAKAHSSVLKGKLSKERPEMIPDYIDKFTSNVTFDISKAKTELGFEPHVSYEDAAKEVVEEYMSLQKEEQKVPEEVSEEQA
ncbi:MAG: NAD-dependent epimerase/dehydratase family protein [Candidatus Aenigmatarchaeota archaeon]